ncbi:right-handed parallel beta-helix repeat-containing protein [Pedobacter sp. PAMC26386]|nr:right-handed parallel beta-helix repeat-containing protein [Pedobacter sp. PAMC26386]
MRKTFKLLPLLVIASFLSCKKSINGAPIPKTVDQAAHAIGKTYYIDPSGNDSNDGQSVSTAWQSITKVNAQTFSPGDQILFKAGAAWAGQLLPKGSGSSGNAIVIDKYGTGNKPIINASGADTTAAVKLIGQSYWQIKNLEVTNQQLAGGTSRLYGIYLKSATSTPYSNVQILDCYVHDVNSYTTESNTALFNKGTGGIIVGGNNSEVLIKGCHVKNVTVEGIRNAGGICSHIIIDSNLIENVYGDGIVLNGANTNSAIIRNIGRNLCYNTNNYNYAGMWTSNSVGTLVAHNEVSGITGGGGNDGQAFDADLGVNGDIFEYNYTHDNKKGFMLFMPSTSNVIVRYNISVNDIASGSNNMRLFNYTSSNSNNRIYNNTFYISANVSYFFQGGFKGEFSNNIIYCTGTVSKFASTTVNASSRFYNNCFYPQSVTTTNGPAGTVSGNIYSDPKFLNAASGATTNFNLQPASPCLSAGIVITNNGGADYYGTSLPAGVPDMGFYQHITGN